VCFFFAGRPAKGERKKKEKRQTNLLEQQRGAVQLIFTFHFFLLLVAAIYQCEIAPFFFPHTHIQNTPN
jgi:hypothetical protein